jgi:O-antigen ligase
MLIAAVPIAFGAVTWNDFPESNVTLAAVRLFGAPVLIVELCTIALSLRLGWQPLEQARSLSKATRALLLGLVAVALGTAIFAAPRTQAAVVWTDISLLHLLFGFAVAHLASGATELERRLIWPAIIVGLCIFAIMLMLFVNIAHTASFDWRYLGFAVSNVRQLGYYSAVGTAAALGSAIGRRGLNHALYVFAGGLTLSIAFWSGTRGAPIALASALLLVVICFPHARSARTLFQALSTSAVAIAIAVQLSPPNPHYGFGRLAASVAAPGINELSSNRIAIWHDAWTGFLLRPLFGFGEAQFGFVRPELGVVYLHPHNAVLQLLFQWGIVGTTIVGFLAVILARACRGVNSTGDPLTIPAAFVALTIAVYSLFDGALFHSYPVMMFAVSAAILISSDTGRRAAKR